VTVTMARDSLDSAYAWQYPHASGHREAGWNFSWGFPCDITDVSWTPGLHHCTEQERSEPQARPNAHE
jgi:hypothetical protein